MNFRDRALQSIRRVADSIEPDGYGCAATILREAVYELGLDELAAPWNTAVTVEPRNGTSATTDCTGIMAKPAPCPECGGKRVVSVFLDSERQPCPCCSAQPAPSADKVIWPDGEFCGAAQPAPSDVVMVPTNKISTLLAFVEEIRVRSTRNRNVIDVVVDVKDFNHLRALAAALRRGGG